MFESQSRYYNDNKDEIIAAIEQGSDYNTVKLACPELKKGYYNIAAMYAVGNVKAQYFPFRGVIVTPRDIKIFRDIIAEGVFDLSQAQVNGFTREEIEACLRSGTHILSEQGYLSRGESRLLTVNDKMLAEINTCAHFIRKLFVPAKTLHRCGSYGMKHAVEQFIRVAEAVEPTNINQYISNVSFIIAAILCGIHTEEIWCGRNAGFWMKSLNRKTTKIATADYLA